MSAMSQCRNDVLTSSQQVFKTSVTHIRHNQVNAINIETGCNVSKTIITQIHLHGAFVSLDNEHCACLEVLIVKRKNSY